MSVCPIILSPRGTILRARTPWRHNVCVEARLLVWLLLVVSLSVFSTQICNAQALRVSSSSQPPSAQSISELSQLEDLETADKAAAPGAAAWAENGHASSPRSEAVQRSTWQESRWLSKTDIAAPIAAADLRKALLDRAGSDEVRQLLCFLIEESSYEPNPATEVRRVVTETFNGSRFADAVEAVSAVQRATVQQVQAAISQLSDENLMWIQTQLDIDFMRDLVFFSDGASEETTTTASSDGNREAQPEVDSSPSEAGSERALWDVAPNDYHNFPSLPSPDYAEPTGRALVAASSGRGGTPAHFAGSAATALNGEQSRRTLKHHLPQAPRTAAARGATRDDGRAEKPSPEEEGVPSLEAEWSASASSLPATTRFYPGQRSQPFYPLRRYQAAYYQPEQRYEQRREAACAQQQQHLPGGYDTQDVPEGMPQNLHPPGLYCWQALQADGLPVGSPIILVPVASSDTLSSSPPVRQEHYNGSGQRGLGGQAIPASQAAAEGISNSAGHAEASTFHGRQLTVENPEEGLLRDGWQPSGWQRNLSSGKKRQEYRQPTSRMGPPRTANYNPSAPAARLRSSPNMVAYQPLFRSPAGVDSPNWVPNGRVMYQPLYRSIAGVDPHWDPNVSWIPVRQYSWVLGAYDTPRSYSNADWMPGASANPKVWIPGGPMGRSFIEQVDLPGEPVEQPVEPAAFPVGPSMGPSVPQEPVYPRPATFGSFMPHFNHHHRLT